MTQNSSHLKGRLGSIVKRPFSSPEPTILLVCARDRDLWQGPKQEVRESRTSGFCAQPQKFETITVTIGYKNGQLLRLRVTWPLPDVSIPGADQRDQGSRDENVKRQKVTSPAHACSGKLVATNGHYGHVCSGHYPLIYQKKKQIVSLSVSSCPRLLTLRLPIYLW